MLFKIREKFVINPCKERGKCLVKVSCKTKGSIKCPIYKKYKKKNDFLEILDENLSIGLALTVLGIGALYIIFTFSLGLLIELKYIWNLF